MGSSMRKFGSMGSGGCTRVPKSLGVYTEEKGASNPKTERLLRGSAGASEARIVYPLSMRTTARPLALLPLSALGVTSVLALLSACDVPDPPTGEPTVCGEGPGVVTVGEGGSRLRPLPEVGGELPIVRGAQGGIHVLVGFSVEAMDLTMEAEYRLENAETGESLGESTALTLRPGLFSSQSGQAIRNPDLLILDPEAPSIERYAGLSAILHLEARDATSHACDQRQVTLSPPEP